MPHSDGGERSGDDSDEEKKYGSLPEKERSKSFNSDELDLSLEEEQFLAEKFQKIQGSPKRRPSLLPGTGTGTDNLFRAEMAKKKAEKHNGPFKGSFPLYLLRSEKKFGNYQISEECIEFLGHFLNSVWHLVSLETIRHASLGRHDALYSASAPGSSTSSPISPLPPSLALRSFDSGSPSSNGAPSSSSAAPPLSPGGSAHFEKIIELPTLETALERTLPVSTVHYSKIQNPAAMAKSPKFSPSDLKKDFQLLANGNPWTVVQLPEVDKFLEQNRLALSDPAAKRLVSVLEYIVHDVLQLAAGLLFSSARSAFTPTDIRDSLKSDASLRELFELHEKFKAKEAYAPIPVFEKRTSRVLGALVLSDTTFPRRGSIGSPRNIRQLSFETSPTTSSPSPLKYQDPFPQRHGIMTEEEMLRPGALTKSKTALDLIYDNPEFSADTLVGPGKTRLEQQDHSLDSPNVRRSRIIKRASTAGPFHYIY